MRHRIPWLRLVVWSGIIAAAAAAACSDDPGALELAARADSTADSLPGDSVPRDTMPRDTIPQDTIPRDTIPRDTIPQDTIPRDTIPRDTIPRDTIPRDTIPRDTIPRDTIPRDTIPRDTILRDTIPRDTVPPGPVVQVVVTPRDQSLAVGDSGVASASLRDAHGREIRDDASIAWLVSDTTVLRTFGGGTGHSWIVVRALRSGRATLELVTGT